MDLHNLNLSAMLNCLEIEQHRSINAAARSREVSQPALSRSIQALEREFGVPLFERSSSGVNPTPFGETLLHHARIVQSELLRCVADIQERKQTGRMSLRVGAPPTVMLWLMMPAIEATYREHDQANIALVEAHPDELLSRLTRGSIDLAVIPTLGDEAAEEAVGIALATSAIGLVVGAQHPLLKRRSAVRREDLDPYLWLLPSWAPSWQRRFEKKLFDVGMEQPRRVFMSNSFQATRQMLLAGDAIALLPEAYVRADLRAGVLRMLPLAAGAGEVTYWAYARRGRALSPATLAFRDRLLAIARRDPEATPA